MYILWKKNQHTQGSLQIFGRLNYIIIIISNIIVLCHCTLSTHVALILSAIYPKVCVTPNDSPPTRKNTKIGERCVCKSATVILGNQ